MLPEALWLESLESVWSLSPLARRFEARPSFDDGFIGGLSSSGDFRLLFALRVFSKLSLDTVVDVNCLSQGL